MGSEIYRRNLIKIYGLLLNKFGSQNWWPGDNGFEVIIGAILTQNSSWNNVEKAINNLKINDVLHYNGIKDLDVKKLASLIKSSGYFNQKARKIKNFINHVESRHNGMLDRFLALNIARLREELLSINGIGKETADSILLYAANKPVFVVDAYTKRIIGRIGFKQEGYDELQELFHSNLARDVKMFNEYHALLVRHGKEYCTKRNPRCEKCPLLRMCEYGKDRFLK